MFSLRGKDFSNLDLKALEYRGYEALRGGDQATNWSESCVW